MSDLYKLKMLFHTVKYLKPIQIVYQIKNKCSDQKQFSDYTFPVMTKKVKLYVPQLDYEASYLCRFDVREFFNKKLILLHHVFDLEHGWYDNTATHLQNFNMQYLEYLIPLAYEYMCTKEKKYYQLLKRILSDWNKQNNSNDAKHPYTTSLRIINLLIVGTLLEDNEIIQNVYPQYRYLLCHQEKNLLGNHYFENLKTILICSIVFNEEKVYQKYVRIFLKEVERQVLGDGVHFELSIMYHKIVLEGIIRVAYVMKQEKKQEYKKLLSIIQKMLDALCSLEKGIGRTPLFNDSGDNVAKYTYQLVNAAKEIFSIEPKDDKFSFSDSGYYKLYDNEVAIMFDAGPIGPDYMPGHGQCDCMSFELSVDQKPIFVNSGTYQYQGEKRKYFRSTAAHNTVMIGNIEQSECWGEHRVARRIHNIKVENVENGFAASYESYVGNKHFRKITLRDKKVLVSDFVHAESKDIIHSFLHVAPGYEVEVKEENIYIKENQDVRCKIVPNAANIIVHDMGELTYYAVEFGKLEHAICIEFVWDLDNQEHGYEIYIY